MPELFKLFVIGGIVFLPPLFLATLALLGSFRTNMVGLVN